MSRAAAVAALAALLAAAPLGGTEIAVAITSPARDVPAIGEVDLAAEVYCQEEVVLVEFFVDGELRAQVRQRPYRARVFFGEDAFERTIRVVAHAVTGAVAEEVLTTPGLSVEQRIDLGLQQLYVTVGSGGRRVLDLAREDFSVYDDGVRQELVTFERGDVPITAVLLIDSSESMQGGRLEKALEGARAFIAGLEGLDQGMVMLFSDRLLRSTPFTDDQAELSLALDGAVPHGGTALNDHLYLGLKSLEIRQGRPVVILFSDGTDAHSVMPMEQVLWKARRSQALIYWIRLVGEDEPQGDTISTAWRDSVASRREVDMLGKVIADSGGEVHTIERLDQLTGAFRGILAELREQYVLGYYPSDPRHDGSWRKVRVEARGSYRMRHRGGYVDGL